MREESHLDDMRSAIRGDFERLAERRGEQELMRVDDEMDRDTLVESIAEVVPEPTAAEPVPEVVPEPEAASAAAAGGRGRGRGRAERAASLMARATVLAALT